MWNKKKGKGSWYKLYEATGIDHKFPCSSNFFLWGLELNPVKFRFKACTSLNLTQKLQLIDCLLHWSKQMHQFHRPWLIAWLIKPGLIEPVRLYYDFEHLQTTTPHRSWRCADPWSSVKLEIEGKGKQKPRKAPPLEAEKFSVSFWSGIDTTHQTEIQLQSGIIWHSFTGVEFDPGCKDYLHPKLLAMSFSRKHSADKNSIRRRADLCRIWIMQVKKFINLSAILKFGRKPTEQSLQVSEQSESGKGMDGEDG